VGWRAKEAGLAVPVDSAALATTSTSTRLATIKRHSWRNRKHAGAAAVSCNSSDGSANTTSCSYAVITPIRWCCCLGAYGRRCSRRFHVEAHHERVARDESPACPDTSRILGRSPAPPASNRAGHFRRRAQALAQRLRDGNRKVFGRPGNAPPGRAQSRPRGELSLHVPEVRVGAIRAGI